jgi:hypothetical protein
MPVDIYLEIQDETERNIWNQIAEKVNETKQQMDEHLALMIRNQVARMLSGKR